MAGTQAKLAISKWQLAKSKATTKAKKKPQARAPVPHKHRNSLTQRAQRNLKALEAPARIVRFPQAKGRIVEAVEFYARHGCNCLSFRFQDGTDLSFEIETGFTLLADFSRWKSGNQRVLRDWPPIGKRQ